MHPEGQAISFTPSGSFHDSVLRCSFHISSHKMAILHAPHADTWELKANHDHVCALQALLPLVAPKVPAGDPLGKRDVFSDRRRREGTQFPTGPDANTHQRNIQLSRGLRAASLECHGAPRGALCQGRRTRGNVCSLGTATTTTNGCRDANDVPSCNFVLLRVDSCTQAANWEGGPSYLVKRWHK